MQESNALSSSAGGPLARTDIEYGDDTFSITGSQLTSTEEVRMTCRYRGDRGPANFIYLGETVEAVTENIVASNERGLSTVGNESVRIRQVEHILSALYGMNVLDTDIILEYVDDDPSDNSTGSISPPIAHLDFKDFTLAIRRSFDAKTRQSVALDKAYIIHDEEGDDPDPSVAVIAPFDGLAVTAHINFPYFWGQQIYNCLITPRAYELNVCWARSFFGTPYPHKNEWSTLRERYPGLIRPRQEHYRSIMIDYDQQKWLTPLYREDEPVRHKLGDFLGDIALAGFQVDAAVYIYKPYHQFNRQCARVLRENLTDTAAHEL